MHGDTFDRGPCAACGLSCTQTASDTHDDYGGIDPCIDFLIPGVSHVCCGHGGRSTPYITFGGEPGQEATTIENKLTLYGASASLMIGLLKAAHAHGGELW